MVQEVVEGGDIVVGGYSSIVYRFRAISALQNVFYLFPQFKIISTNFRQIFRAISGRWLSTYFRVKLRAFSAFPTGPCTCMYMVQLQQTKKDPKKKWPEWKTTTQKKDKTVNKSSTTVRHILLATLTFIAFTKVKHKNVLSHFFTLSMGHILVNRKNLWSKFSTNDNSPNSFFKGGVRHDSTV